MALGGGTYTKKDKPIPGIYINVVSKNIGVGLNADGGIVATALPLNYGMTEDMIEMTADGFSIDAPKKLGYESYREELRCLREIFKGAKKVLIYNLNQRAKKATATAGTLKATAKFPGVRGNDYAVKVEKLEDRFLLEVFQDGYTVFKKPGSELVDFENDYVDFQGEIKEGIETAGINLEGGTNGTVQDEDYDKFLQVLEEFDCNVVTVASKKESINRKVVNFVIRMRETEGVKLQAVLYVPDENMYDHEGVVEVQNRCAEEEANAVYWVAGKQANGSLGDNLTNVKYDGEYSIEPIQSTKRANELLNKGKFMFYRKNRETRVLEDINSLVTFSTEKDKEFSKNQIIRTIDKRATDIARIFNDKYLGHMANNEDGRISFWHDLVLNAEALQRAGAIENYVETDTVVTKGTEKDEVVVEDTIQPTMAMQKLYVTIHVI